MSIRRRGCVLGFLFACSVHCAGAIEIIKNEQFSADFDLHLGSAFIYNKNQDFGATTSTSNLPVDRTSSRVEGFAKPALKLGWETPVGHLYSAISDVSAFTQGGTDGLGMTRANPSSSGVDEAFIGWNSLFFAERNPLGIDLSTGRQSFILGEGFLIGEGHADQGHDAAYWLGPRVAFEEASVARFSYSAFKVQLFDLLATGDVDVIDYHERFRTRGGSLGWRSTEGTEAEVLYTKTRDSVSTARDGLTNKGVRLTNLDFMGLSGSGEYIWQNHVDLGHDHAWYLQTTYGIDSPVGKVSLMYRRSEFSAGYDPLLYGCPELGKWCSGEIVGGSMLFNSNEKINMYRVDLAPNSSVRVGGVFYDIDNYDTVLRATSKDFAQEVNFYADIVATPHVTLGGLVGVARPQSGAKNMLGDSENSTLLELYAYYSF